MDREKVLINYWLPVFNEQMQHDDEDWECIDADQAKESYLFLYWLREWSDDSRGLLFNTLTKKEGLTP